MNKFNQIQQFRSAKNFLAQKKYKKALLAYDELLKTELKSRDLLLINRGYVFLSLNKYPEMLKSCSDATIVNPENSLGWNCKGESLYYLGQYQEALVAFNHALQINPHKNIFLLNKSRVLSVLQQYKQAISAIDQAINFEAKLPTKTEVNRQNLAIAHSQRGENLLKIKQHSLAMKAFENSLAYAPEHLEAQQGLGVALYELNHHREAQAIFTRILERADLTKEQQAINFLYQGISLCKMQDFKKAKIAFAQVLKLGKDPAAQKIAKAGCGIR